MLKLSIFILVTFFSLPGFSQEGERKAPLSSGGGSVTIMGSSPEAPAAVAPDSEIPKSTEDDEAVVEEVMQVREKQLEKIKQIQEPLGAGEDEATPAAAAGTAADELQKLGYASLTPKALMDDRVLALLQKQLKDNGLSKLSDQEVKLLIREKTKSSFWGRTFTKFPKLLDIAADIVRSPEALPGLVGVLVRKKDLKDYGYVWLVIFIFSLFIKGRVNNTKWGFGTRFLAKLGISLALTCVTFYVFYTFFEVEITPTLQIIGKHLF